MDPKEKEEIGQPSDGGAEEHPEQITIAEGDWRNKLDGPLQTLYVEWQEDAASVKQKTFLAEVNEKPVGPDGKKELRVPVLVKRKAGTDVIVHDNAIELSLQANHSWGVCYLPVEKLPDFASLDGVEYLWASLKNTVSNDNARELVGLPAYAAANPDSGRGENCIVAIVDSGVDITHEMFAKKKILKVWDQAARKVAGSHVKYGCVYSNFPKGYERPLAEYEGDPDGHGTHVAGTACGQHQRWGGIAPDAPLIVVKTPMYDHQLEDALDWIHEIADAENMPVVTNMSLGGLAGPNDGHGPLARSLDEKVGEGKILCVAAGNEGNDGIHARSNGGDTDIVVNVPEYNIGVYFNIWINSGKDFSLKITSPDNRSYVLKRSGHAGDPLTPIPFHTKRFANATIGLAVNHNSHGRKYEQDVWLELKRSWHSDIPEGEWTITISSEEHKSVHAWIPMYKLRDNRPVRGSYRPTFATFRDDHYTIGSPGTAENAITVAASTSRTSWESNYPARITLEMLGSSYRGIGKVANFSSRGPLRLRKHPKPDLCAPGQMIISANSSQAYPPAPNYMVMREDPNYRVMNGTSMSCPVVAGMAAVLLSEQPKLTAKQIVQRLTAGSPNWNAEIGYGHAHF